MATPRNSWLFCAVLALVGASFPSAGRAWDPVTLDEQLPERLSLRVQHRTRFEYLDHPFRSTGSDHGDAFLLRTLVHGRVKLAEGVHVGAELQDSRAEDADDARLTATVVNAVELLRAYLEFERADLWGGELSARMGRITLDVGSRRFVARNRFRNTINGFTGIDVEWKGAGGTTLRGFWTLPVLRLPRSPERLHDNEIRNDEESFDRQFWGLFASRALAGVGTGELFVFGLHERDDPDRVTRRRELYTPGFRIYRGAQTGRFDYQVETALQLGHSRATASGARRDHFAHFHHAELGYSFEAAWTPRLVLQYDYASGDRELGDGDNERFDTLFGARRFDFGPTSLYGPFARSNLNTPGLRLQVKPTPRVRSFVSFRGFWLAESRDAWTTTGIRDSSGDSSRYLGSQLEFRVRWKVLPGNLSLEAGYAHLFAGDFVDDASIGKEGRDSNYVYTQIGIGF